MASNGVSLETAARERVRGGSSGVFVRAVELELLEDVWRTGVPSRRGSGGSGVFRCELSNGERYERKSRIDFRD